MPSAPPTHSDPLPRSPISKSHVNKEEGRGKGSNIIGKMKTSDWLADWRNEGEACKQLIWCCTDNRSISSARYRILPCLSGSKAKESKIVWNSRIWTTNPHDWTNSLATMIQPRCIRTNLEVCLSEVSITLFWKRGYISRHVLNFLVGASKWFLN